MQNPAIQSLPACLAQIKVHVIVLFSHGLNFSSPGFKKASAYFFPPAWWVSLISPALLQYTTLKTPSVSLIRLLHSQLRCHYAPCKVAAGLFSVSFNGSLNERGIISSHGNGNETAYLSTSQLRKIYVEPITRLKKHSDSFHAFVCCTYVIYIIPKICKCVHTV